MLLHQYTSEKEVSGNTPDNRVIVLLLLMCKARVRIVHIQVSREGETLVLSDLIWQPRPLLKKDKVIKRNIHAIS